MSDLNLIVLCGRLVADAVFAERDGFLSVRMRLATSHKVGKKDAPLQERTVYHNVQTTLDMKPHLVDLWKERCLKGARLHIQGILEMDKVEKDGQTRYHAVVRAASRNIVLPDAAPPSAKDTKSTAAPNKRDIPQTLVNRRDVLNFNN